MNKIIALKNDVTDQIICEVNNTQKMCQALLQTPHYKKLGSEGVFAIIEKAKSIGVSPIDALNGGFFFVQGKVEMTSAMMNQLIRMNKHSITKDKRSNETICILHGKRADNNDTWVESFSIEDAKQAGIYRNQWLKYPKDMLFARALSRLARQLFPDIIKGCYVQGEIADAPALNAPVEQLSNDSVKETMVEESLIDSISEEEFKELDCWLGENSDLRANISAFIKKKWGIEDLRKMPREIYTHALNRAKQQYLEEEHMCGEHLQTIVD